jgi:hypothetical protein
MSDWDEEALREIGNLDSARLAIRGALATIRDLQDLNSQVKAEVQEEAAKRKLAEAKSAELAGQIEQWRKQAEGWEQESRQRAADEESWRNAARLQVRAEERVRIEEGRARVEAELSALRAELMQMAQASQEKERKWEALRKQIEARDAELMAAQREKLELRNRFHQDHEMIESLRQARDREISASIRSRELEIEDKDRENKALREQLQQASQASTVFQAEFELRVKEREENLLREYRQREHQLTEQYSKREMELQSSWAELENGLWQKTKEAREKLDAAVSQQFEERARALADRSAEVEAQLASARKAQEEEFVRRCTEAEARYSEAERRLRENWAVKEQRALKNFEEELAAEKLSLAGQWTGKIRAMEANEAERQRQHLLNAERLESQYKHKTAMLLEEHALKEAERISRQDDLIAKKTAELALAHEERLGALRVLETAHQEEYLARKNEAETEINRRRMELLEEHERAVELEKQALQEQLEQSGRALDEAFQAKVADVERAHAALEEQYRSWKAGLTAEHAQKEKNLDSQWAAREQELVRKYEAALEHQRTAFHLEAQKTREQFELQRRRGENELVQSGQVMKSEYERLETELKAAAERREDNLRLKHQEDLARARDDYRRTVSLNSEHAANENARLREEFRLQLDALREKSQRESDAKDRLLSDAALRIKQLQDEAAAKTPKPQD